MRTDQFTKQLLVAVILALVLPLVAGGILIQVAGNDIQFTLAGLEDTSSVAWAAQFLSTKTGIILYVIAAIAFFIAALLPVLLSTSGSEEADDEYEEPSANDQRETGTVKWFNVSKGFGFITRDKGDDIFVHFRSIRGRGHRSLKQGQRVRFNVREGDKGLQAEDVSVTR